ncbi:hypothetical protein ANCDUO_11828 [Ancylostoma duodenale]|uniref:Uncharacterized protein n=1 Tax=Ancylostoma duodenale TaxID=51022 RepID=A0A0C2GLN1_9BILA|nr:hypothetical protein ANCDUO_11828 [Ancylostoma duodenale]
MKKENGKPRVKDETQLLQSRVRYVATGPMADTTGSGLVTAAAASSRGACGRTLHTHPAIMTASSTKLAGIGVRRAVWRTVQRERGPRCVMPAFTTAERCKSRGEDQNKNEHCEIVPTYSVDDLFVAAMFAVSQSVLLAFTTREERRELLTAKYPHFLALAISTADARMRKHDTGARNNNVEKHEHFGY